MTNVNGSDDNTEKAARAAGVSRNARRRAAAPGVQRPRVPGTGNVTSAAAATKDSVGEGRGAAAGAAKRASASSRQAARGVGRAAVDVSGRGRGAGGQVTRAGRGAAGEGTRRAAAAAQTGQSVAGDAVATSTKAASGALGAVRSTVLAATGASLGFLIGKAVLLLQLIKRLALRLALMALDALTVLAQLLRERAAAASGRPDARAVNEGVDR